MKNFLRPLLTATILVLLIPSFSLRSQTANLATGYNTRFAGSGECADCHNSQVSPAGASIALAEAWRSSMMANSAKDPLWKAQVSVERKNNPGFETAIEQKCTSCHAPAGNFDAALNGTGYGLADLTADPFGKDGVQCTVCHQITAESLGQYSGHPGFGIYKSIWGPYEQPNSMPMLNFTGYTPIYSEHISHSLLCGTCHTLLTQAILSDGSLSETFFPEQTVFQEWLNSDYPAEGLSCQACHVPRIDGPIKISSRPPLLAPRDFYGQHHFVGANVFMNTLFKENQAELELTAGVVPLDSTRNRMLRSLQEQSVKLELLSVNRTENELKVKVILENLAGHKLPSGFPSRRLWIELLAVNSQGEPVFHSGKMSSDGTIIGEDPNVEEHHNLIVSDQEVQIYEMVMADQEGNETTELLRAIRPLKDNRIPPRGFTSIHSAYDTIAIVGNAETDPDFNRSTVREGTGTDALVYSIQLKPGDGSIQVVARLFYQTISAEWLDDLTASGTDEAQAFDAMLEKSEAGPVLMAEAEMQSLVTNTPDPSILKPPRLYPNPIQDQLYIESGNAPYRLIIYSLDGRRLFNQSFDQDISQINFRELGFSNGIYIVQVEQNNSSIFEKIVLN